MTYIISGCLLLLQTVILENFDALTSIYFQDVWYKLLNIMVFFWKLNRSSISEFINSSTFYVYGSIFIMICYFPYY